MRGSPAVCSAWVRRPTRGVHDLPVALGTDAGPVLVGALLDELRERKILAPALSTIERLAWETRRPGQRRELRVAP